MRSEGQALICPYCGRKLPYTMGRLPAHDAPGGRCDGSRRGVASADAFGRVVLMADRSKEAREAIKREGEETADWKRSAPHDFRGNGAVCADCGLPEKSKIHHT